MSDHKNIENIKDPNISKVNIDQSFLTNDQKNVILKKITDLNNTCFVINPSKTPQKKNIRNPTQTYIQIIQ